MIAIRCQHHGLARWYDDFVDPGHFGDAIFHVVGMEFRAAGCRAAHTDEAILASYREDVQEDRGVLPSGRCRPYLRADIENVEHTPDGKYKVTIVMENVYPEYEMYVLVPQVTAMAQVGPMWQEVPTADISTSEVHAGTVVKLDHRLEIQRLVEIPKGPNYFELLPGYYHVKFENTILVSPVAEPKDDIEEKGNTYFIHLLPVDADLNKVRQQNKFPGGNIPIYLPMPPH